jgi:chromosome segregation ATPase
VSEMQQPGESLGVSEISIDQLTAENERLRQRIAQLEDELVDIQARANAAVGEWQERAYWLDRLHIDLNSLMSQPGANELRIALKAARAVFWRVKRIKRRLTRP